MTEYQIMVYRKKYFSDRIDQATCPDELKRLNYKLKAIENRLQLYVESGVSRMATNYYMQGGKD